MNKISVKINGKDSVIESNSSVSKLLVQFKMSNKWVAVQINENIIEKNEFDNYIINVNDQIEIIRPMGGG